MRALGEGLLVFAPETADGQLGQVAAIESLTIQGLLTRAFNVQFVSGHVRVSEGATLFYLGQWPCNGA